MQTVVESNCKSLFNPDSFKFTAHINRLTEFNSENGW